MIRKILRELRRYVLRIDANSDYRQHLFEDLQRYLGGRRPKRILEIGPKDGKDTRRLLTLEPERLTLIDLPRLEESNRLWLQQINSPKIEYISANLMYSPIVPTLASFDLVWCPGVLYHNPEQLRMVRRLYDLMRPGGVLVLESATARKRRLRRLNCVEIIYPPSEEIKKKYHISMNISHLPSAKAMESWMAMVGLENITLSSCHRKISYGLARGRAAYIATKPIQPRTGKYYAFGEEEGFAIGKAL
jgi:SAM-dependent methyltransferase